MYDGKEQIMRNNLENVRQRGVELFLEGEPSSPGEIAGKCIGEDCVYMADYVLDDRGVLRELRYDKISDWK